MFRKHPDNPFCGVPETGTPQKRGAFTKADFE